MELSPDETKIRPQNYIISTICLFFDSYMFSLIMYRNILLVDEPFIKILFNLLSVFSLSCLFSDELKAPQWQHAVTKQNMHGGESASTSKGEWRVYYINSFILHWKSLWEQRLILSDLYLVRAYIMMANQVNTLQRTVYSRCLCKTQQPKSQHLQFQRSSSRWLPTRKNCTINWLTESLNNSHV